jgi:4-hydroxybenzoate polyprenyltransferase
VASNSKKMPIWVWVVLLIIVLIIIDWIQENKWIIGIAIAVGIVAVIYWFIKRGKDNTNP